MSAGRCRRPVLAPLLVALYALCFVHNIGTYLSFEDDYTSYLFGGLSLTSAYGRDLFSASVEHLERRTLDLEAPAVNERLLALYDMRGSMQQNYIAFSAATAFSSILLLPVYQAGWFDYPRYLVSVVIFSKFILFGLVAVALVFGLRVGGRQFFAVMVLTILASYALENLLQFDAFRRVGADTGFRDYVFDIGRMILSPSEAYQVYGATSRNFAQMLILVAAVTRWRNRLGIAYLLLAMAALFHTKYGAVAVATFVAYDGLAGRFAHQHIRVFAIAVFALMLPTAIEGVVFAEVLNKYLSSRTTFFTAAAGIAVGVAATWVHVLASRGKLSRPIGLGADFSRRLLALPLIEAATLFFLISASFFASRNMLEGLDPAVAWFTWELLTPRLSTIFGSVILAAAAFQLYQAGLWRVFNDLARVRLFGLAFILAIAWSSLLLDANGVYKRGFSNMIEQIEEREEDLMKPLNGDVGYRDQERLFYNLIKSVHEGEDHVTPLVEWPPASVSNVPSSDSEQ